MPNGTFAATLDAYWSLLESNLLWTLAMTKGTKYKFLSDDLLRKFDYEVAWCPIWLMWPETDGAQWRLARGRRGPAADLRDTFPIHVEAATAGWNPRLILNLMHIFRTAMEADFAAAASKLSTVGVEEVEFHGLLYQPRPGPNDAIDSWVARVTCVNRFRIS